MGTIARGTPLGTIMSPCLGFRTSANLFPMLLSVPVGFCVSADLFPLLLPGFWVLYLGRSVSWTVIETFRVLHLGKSVSYTLIGAAWAVEAQDGRGAAKWRGPSSCRLSKEASRMDQEK
jgi:hypothetical protein